MGGTSGVKETAARLARGLVIVGAVVVVVGTVTGFASGWFWPFDLVASFRVQLLAAGVLLLGLATVIERRTLVVVPLVLAVVVNALLIVPLYRGRADVPAEARIVTIAHINMQGGRGDVARSSRRSAHTPPT